MSDLLDLRFAADPEITHGTRGVVCSRVEEVLRINRLGIYSLTSTTAESSIKVFLGIRTQDAAEHTHRQLQNHAAALDPAAKRLQTRRGIWPR